MIPEELLSQLQQLTPFEDDFVITKGISGIDISQPIEINNLLMRKKTYTYGLTPKGDWPFEVGKTFPIVDIFGYKETYTTLGLLFVELLLSQEKCLEFILTQPHSQIQSFYVYLELEGDLTDFDFWLRKQVTVQYNSFTYAPIEVEKFPFSQDMGGRRMTPETYNDPIFLYSQNDNRKRNNQAFKDQEDQLVFLANINSLLHLATLLLDIGQNENKTKEICLENPTFGYGGAAEHSIQARFWLPNSFAFFDAERLEDLSF